MHFFYILDVLLVKEQTRFDFIQEDLVFLINIKIYWNLSLFEYSNFIKYL